jgi:hypothetical protein
MQMAAARQTLAWTLSFIGGQDRHREDEKISFAEAQEFFRQPVNPFVFCLHLFRFLLAVFFLLLASVVLKKKPKGVNSI